MSYTIAIAGKGGTGKTTLAALLIRELRHRGLGPILAVDADPNANLGEVLGVKVHTTIGSICEQATGSISAVPAGMTKEDYLEYHIQAALTEAKGFDLLSMGRPEGPGCYCYVNNLVRKIVDTLITNYPLVIMDNEAGLEHLSRRTTRAADWLLILSDSSLRGLQAARRILELSRELKLAISKYGLVVSRMRGQLSLQFYEQLEKLDLPLLATIPADEQITRYDAQGLPLMELPPASPAVAAVAKLLDKVEAR